MSCKKCEECEIYYLGTVVSIKAEYCGEELDELKKNNPWNETTKTGIKCD